MSLVSWLESNNIAFEQSGNIYIIDNVFYYHIHHKDGKIFDQEFKLIISDQELYQIAESNTNHVIYYFGSQWYWSSLDKQELNLLKYLGESTQYSNELRGFLGIHGKYEILNGTRDYGDWCKKAKFLGYGALGICEKHTLAGCYSFQQQCLANNIKPIIGETLTVKAGDYKYDVKVYCNNEQGWKNLLHLHNINNIVNNADLFISEDNLLTYHQGLSIVICTDTILTKTSTQIWNLPHIYYQIDFSEFISNSKDKERLERLQNYIQHLQIPPILVSDAYYLDSEDYKIKTLLNEIGRVGFQNLSKSQYLKHFKEIEEQARVLFKDVDLFNAVFQAAKENVNILCNISNFQIIKKQSYLPQYIMDEEEKSLFTDNYNLFAYYIEKGYKKKVLENGLSDELYQERLIREIEVLQRGQVIDYFLILHDIVKYCKSQNILTGIGRGSAAGSLVAYLLNIVEVDPIKYDLLFERFLNEARLLKGTLPDIDQDVPSKYRDQVIDYIINKYGADNVVGIGTAQNFKLKSLYKDLLKYKGESFQDANKISSVLPRDIEFGTIQSIFQLTSKNPLIRKSVEKHHDVVEIVDKILGQPRSFGTHAAGIVITPDVNQEGELMTTAKFIPLRKDAHMNITEWEKETLESNGFLKIDLLGLSQLDKIMEIIHLVKVNSQKDIDILTTPLDDPKTFELFRKGFNEDVFQFGATGLKEYCRSLQPDTINDLIATVALYRPGAIGSGAHLRYVNIKHGKEAPKYYRGSEEILKDTYSVMVYQEQVMRMCVDLAGFSPKEADDIRKAIAKKELTVLEKLKERFTNGVVELSSYTFDEAEALWKDIEYFGEYSFNKSHAACYAVTGYYTQWLKAHYPIEFYTVALSHSDEFSLGNIISEIKLNSDVTLKGPDINASEAFFGQNPTNREIYWGLASIKYLGEKGVQHIVNSKVQDGKFYSFDEFLSRCGSKLNKRSLTNLVLCGAFDDLEKITDPISRLFTIEKFADSQYVKELINKYKLITPLAFSLIQKELCGYNDLDFQAMSLQRKAIPFDSLSLDLAEKNIKVCGQIEEAKEFNTKNGKSGNVLLSQGSSKLYVTFWNESWLKYKEVLNPDKIILMSGVAKIDSRTKKIRMYATNFSQVEIL